jgi:hypothetical protein
MLVVRVQIIEHLNRLREVVRKFTKDFSSSYVALCGSDYSICFNSVLTLKGFMSDYFYALAEYNY